MQQCVVLAAVQGAALLWAFGTLMGNPSFTSDQGSPYPLAPAYDMVPMAFSARNGGGMGHDLCEPHITTVILGDLWRAALQMPGAMSSAFKQSPDSVRGSLHAFRPPWCICLRPGRGWGAWHECQARGELERIESGRALYWVVAWRSNRLIRLGVHCRPIRLRPVSLHR